MRLFLLPITSRNTLIYAQRLNKQLTAEQTRIEKLSARANGIWQRWESHEKGWQKRVTSWGNRLFARIPYQEWGLKSVPPLSARRKGDELKDATEEKEKVEVLFPGRVLPVDKVSDVLRTLAVERQAFHRQRMVWSLVGMPFTVPFALVPVVPNLPFMYLVFRSFSHWKALAGARHITYLLDNKLIEYSQSALLQKIYDIKELPREVLKSIKESLPAKKEDSDTQAVAAAASETFVRAVEDETLAKADDGMEPVDPQGLLVTEGTGHLVSLCFGIPQVDAEIARAIEQVKKQVAEENKASSQGQGGEKEGKL